MKKYILLACISLFVSFTGAMELSKGSRFVEAARDGEYAQVEAYLNEGVDENEKHSDPSVGCSAVVAAANEGHDDVVELLLKRGAEVNIIHETDINESGIDLGVIRLPAFGSSALNFASERGHESTVKLLLAHNADPAWFNGLGHTPLNNAVANGHTGIVKALLEAGAPVNYIAKLFLKRGSNPCAGSPIYVKGTFNLASTGGTKYSPLYTAVDRGDKDIAILLLEHGADVVATGSHIELLALAKADEEMVALLEKAGAPLTYVASCHLLAACVMGNSLANIRLLAQSGVSLEERDSEFEATPLIWCANNGLHGPCKLLVDLGARLNAQNKNDMTALDCARVKYRKEIVRLVEYLHNTQEPVLRGCNKSLIRIMNYPDIIALLEEHHETVPSLVSLCIQKVRELLRQGTLTKEDLENVLERERVNPLGLEKVFIEDEDAAEAWSEAQRKCTDVIDISLLLTGL